MKKILAGVLATASLMAMTVSASATTNEKAVTKAGEVTYEVTVTAPKVVLDLVMPAKMSAALNPYGAEIKLDTATIPTTTKAGIASVAYEVKNKSTDYGVYIDATAITTITTTDKPNADKTPAWGVNPAKVVPAAASADGVKNANMVLQGFASVSAMKTAADGTLETASKAATSSAQGVLVLDSTVQADKTNGIVAGQTNQKKLLFVAAATNATTPTTVYMGFIGKLGATSTTDATKEVVWNEDDAINVNLVLKVTAGPKSLT